MPRRPLLPLLRVGVFLAAGLVLFWPKRVRQQAPVPAVWATDVDAYGAGVLQLGEKATPLPGQKRPPCNRDIEVEVAGACWVQHTRKPPCPAGLYEGVGVCLLPVKAERPATSVGR